MKQIGWSLIDIFVENSQTKIEPSKQSWGLQFWSKCFFGLKSFLDHFLFFFCLTRPPRTHLGTNMNPKRNTYRSARNGMFQNRPVRCHAGQGWRDFARDKPAVDGHFGWYFFKEKWHRMVFVEVLGWIEALLWPIVAIFLLWLLCASSNNRRCADLPKQ